MSSNKMIPVIDVEGWPEVVESKEGKKYLKLDVRGGSIFVGLLEKYHGIKIGVPGVFKFEVGYSDKGVRLALKDWKQ